MKISQKIFSFIVLQLVLVGCSSSQVANKTSSFSGLFECDGYKANGQGESFQVAPFSQKIEHKVVNGIDVIVTKRSDSEKMKAYGEMPSSVDIWILDGTWRHTTVKAGGKLIAGKRMAKFTDESKNSIVWKSEYPVYVDNRGKKWNAAKYGGKWWIDPKTGNKKSTTVFVDKEVTCRRKL